MRREDTARLGRIAICASGLLAVWWVTAVASPARAAPRTLDFTGTLSFGLTVGFYPPKTATGAGGAVASAITSGGHLSTLAIPGGFAPITTSVPVTSSATIGSFWYTGVGNRSATITGISGGPPLGSGVMEMQGLLKVCVFDPADCQYQNVAVPLSPVSGVGMGIGGTQTVTGAVLITMQHAPWTVGQPTMTIHTPNSTISMPVLPGGFAGPPSRTAWNSGVVQLVTVSKVFTSLKGAFPELPIFAVMNLHMVPEPGTLLLLGSGVAGLAVAGRRRRRGRDPRGSARRHAAAF